jgi:type IX secretion system PorP/SprF family membrane protein
MSGIIQILLHAFLFSAIFSRCISGQTYHFSNIHENLYLNNPAVITQIEKIRFQALYRNQWPGNSDFITYNAAGYYKSEPLNSTLGAVFLRDSQGEGIVNYDYFSLLYAYKTRITRNWFFAGGIQAAYSIYSTNFSQQTFNNNQTPVVTLDERSPSFDFSTGIVISYGEVARYGLSVSKLGAMLPSSDSYQGLQLNLSYEGGIVMARNHSFSEYQIEPLVFLSLQKNFSELLYGARLNYNTFIGGMYVRQNLKFQYDAIIILLGTRFGNAGFYYCYDINLSGFDSRFTNLAAHEVTFLYDLEYKRKMNKRGAIKCPQI